MKKTILLDEKTEEVQYLCRKDKRLAKVIGMIGPITYTVYHDSYAFLVHEIIEQMLSVRAAAVIYGRLERLCDGRISPHSISALSDEQIRSIGTSMLKVGYIRSLTNAVMSGSLIFDELEKMDDKAVTKKLTEVKGIGSWSAKMYLLFVLNRPDILPTEDVAFLQSYRWLYKTVDCSPATVTAKCKKWKPYSSIAARYLYKSLDMGLTKREFHLYK